ncbi:MAG: Bifunctional phosphoglucose/phosphomannose isomerase [Candidatus Heimdallarchaeota archaeon LC_3]|nr:MAG: Bifunctional phosphoglucose/phosphomannose isomerase [Candidatus Heimdallarchaeota archaeon LC_3]
MFEIKYGAKMNLLDDKPLMEKLDQSNQLSWIQNWESMFNQAFDTGSSIKIPKKINIGKKEITLNYSQKFSSIIVIGMGGSAISGDYLSSILSREENFSTPVQVIRGYHIPKWVSLSTLVIAVSYSGNTRETLTCLYKALQVQASTILLSSGGTIEEVAKKYSIPWIKLPSGYQPRAAFPVIFGTIIGLFDKLFPTLTLSNKIKNIGNVINNIITRFGPDQPSTNNLSKNLASKLHNKIPIIISSELALITRWKGQINENSKMIAYMDVFPELMHNSYY